MCECSSMIQFLQWTCASFCRYYEFIQVVLIGRPSAGAGQAEASHAKDFHML